MRTKLSILATIVAVGALGAGIAQAASGGTGHTVKPAAAPTRVSAQVLFAVVGEERTVGYHYDLKYTVGV